jgi:hypothetical protein
VPINPCPVGGEYKGNSPVKDEDRPIIWKWAKDNTNFEDFVGTSKAINDHFFGGRAPQSWISDLIGGRKTKTSFGRIYDDMYNEMWRRNSDRQNMIRYAKELNKYAGTGVWPKVANTVWNLGRSLETIGHAIVFPVSHAGDLLFHPTEWGRYFKGLGDVYRGAYGRDFHRNRMAEMERDPWFRIAMDSKVEAGSGSKPTGILGSGVPSWLEKRFGETPVLRNVLGSASRAWDMLGTIRFEMWKAAMKKKVTPNMSAAEILDYGREYAEWANDATGAGKGKIANLGGGGLFGPKLTQSKINRVSEIVKTPMDFANWKNLTPGQRAVAWKRLGGATQYLTTRIGFLAANAALLKLLKSNQKINFTDPNKGDWMQFKGYGLEAGVPGITTELRAMSRVLSLTYWEYAPDSVKQRLAQKFGQSFAQKPRETGVKAVYDIGKDYASGKLNPSVERISEVLSGKDWKGRPVPWSPDQGTPEKPKLGIGEYSASIGPIPLQGPIKYVYDQLKGTAGASQATQIVKGLIVAGLGATGAHIGEEQEPKPPKSSGRATSPKPFGTRLGAKWPKRSTTP